VHNTSDTLKWGGMDGVKGVGLHLRSFLGERSRDLYRLWDIMIGSSTKICYHRLLINKTLLWSTPSAYQQHFINRDFFVHSWLIVGNLGQGMRCCKCTSNAMYIGVRATRKSVSRSRAHVVSWCRWQAKSLAHIKAIMAVSRDDPARHF